MKRFAVTAAAARAIERDTPAAVWTDGGKIPMKTRNPFNPSTLMAALAISAAALSAAAPARAADTTEPFDIGASDGELYLGYDGVGLGGDERTVNGEILLGYGVSDRFSAFVGTALNGSETLVSESTTFYFGVFGTLLDSEHLDLDLTADVASDNSEDSRLSVTPALELNFDRDPELNKWGVYLRAGLPFYGRAEEAVPEAELTDVVEPAGDEVAVRIESTAGIYYTPFADNQLLLEYDMGFLPQPADDERGVEVGALALGYNVAVSDALELINQISVDIPQRGEISSVAFMTGFIATVPGASSPAAASDDTVAADEERSPQLL
jgi:hypothetical protein